MSIEGINHRHGYTNKNEPSSKMSCCSKEEDLLLLWDSLLWEKHIFPFLDLPSLVFSLRPVNQQLKQIVEKHLIETFLQNTAEWVSTSNDLNTGEDYTHHVTFVIRTMNNSETKDDKENEPKQQQQQLVEKAVSLFENVWEQEQCPREASLVKYLQFVPGEEPDAEEEDEYENDDPNEALMAAEDYQVELNHNKLRQELKETGRIANETDEYGWEIQIDQSSPAAAIPWTQGEEEQPCFAPFQQKDMIGSFEYDDEQCHFSNADSEDPDSKEVDNENAIALSRCIKILVDHLVLPENHNETEQQQQAANNSSTTAQVATLAYTKYDSNYQEAIGYQAKHYCLEIDLEDDKGNKNHKILLEMHILGERRSGRYPDAMVQI